MDSDLNQHCLQHRKNLGSTRLELNSRMLIKVGIRSGTKNMNTDYGTVILNISPSNYTHNTVHHYCQNLVGWLMQVFYWYRHIKVHLLMLESWGLPWLSQLCFTKSPTNTHLQQPTSFPISSTYLWILELYLYSTHLNMAFVLLINIKCWHLNIYQPDEFNIQQREKAKLIIT